MCIRDRINRYLRAEYNNMVDRMKTLYFNGNIYTGDDFVTALLGENGVIMNTGRGAEQYAGEAERIDLRGKTVIPGFNDSHLHLYGLGKYLRSVQLSGCRSIEDIIASTRAFIADNQIPPGKVVTGRGWNEDYFSLERRHPTKEDLDKISSEHPIILRRVCGPVSYTHLRERRNISVQLSIAPRKV